MKVFVVSLVSMDGPSQNYAVFDNEAAVEEFCSARPVSSDCKWEYEEFEIGQTDLVW